MSAREAAWRVCYEVLAARVATPEWGFMNYGFSQSESEGEALVLEPADEPDRLGIQLYDHVLSGLDLRGRDVLEVGSGRGGGASYVCRDRLPRAMTGLDFSARAIELSQRHRLGQGLTFVRGDAQAMPFDDDAFDVVVNVESSHCYDSVPSFLAEVHRVLRPGGRLAFADFRTPARLAVLREQLSASPLRLVGERDITAEVFAALQLDNQRKLALIELLIPRVFHRPFARFAGIHGSSTYAAFETGGLRYLSAQLIKDPGPASQTKEQPR